MGTTAVAKNETRAHRKLPSGIQNMCGTDYSQALNCGTPCPGVSFAADDILRVACVYLIC